MDPPVSEIKTEPAAQSQLVRPQLVDGESAGGDVIMV